MPKWMLSTRSRTKRAYIPLLALLIFLVAFWGVYSSRDQTQSPPTNTSRTTVPSPKQDTTPKNVNPDSESMKELQTLEQVKPAPAPTGSNSANMPSSVNSQPSAQHPSDSAPGQAKEKAQAENRRTKNGSSLACVMGVCL